MEIIKINKLMEDQNMKDTRFFLMEFGREVMKNVGEELTEKSCLVFSTRRLIT